MKLAVAFACARTLLTLSKTTHRFAAAQQSIGHGVCLRLSTFRAKATTAMASASDRGGNVGYALFDATGTLMHLKEPVGETYSRYATMHGFDVGSPADLELRFKTSYTKTVCCGD